MRQINQHNLQLIKDWCNSSWESEEQWIEAYNKHQFETIQALNKLNTPLNKRITYFFTTIIFLAGISFFITLTCFIALFLYDLRRKPYVLLIVVITFFIIFKYKSKQWNKNNL
jgi:hypothetical protein